MKLTVDRDRIKEPSKRTIEEPQTIDQYNIDLEKGNDEVERGGYTTIVDLKAEADKW